MASAVKAGQITTNVAARQKYYSLAQKLTADEAMMIFAYNAPYIYAWRKNVTGFQVTPTLSYHMEDVKKK